MLHPLLPPLRRPPWPMLPAPAFSPAVLCAVRALGRATAMLQLAPPQAGRYLYFCPVAPVLSEWPAAVSRTSLPMPITLSTTRRSALAFGSVVRMRSFSTSCVAMVLHGAKRAARVAAINSMHGAAPPPWQTAWQHLGAQHCHWPSACTWLLLPGLAPSLLEHGETMGGRPTQPRQVFVDVPHASVLACPKPSGSWPK